MVPEEFDEFDEGLDNDGGFDEVPKSAHVRFSMGITALWSDLQENCFIK